MALTFSKADRLTQNSEFRRVKVEGRSFSGRLMTLGVLKHVDRTKFGIIVTRRIGGAVVRNRVRRRLREILRLSRCHWAPGIWCVIVARHGAAKASFSDLQGEWLRLASRAQVWSPEKVVSSGSEGESTAKE